MTRKEWDRIKAAAELLGLGEKASLAEIKKAFRRLSKKHHPDMQGPKQKKAMVSMHSLNEAYQVLLDYCGTYRFPLHPGENEEMEGEDWWFERFGQDHMWCRGCEPEEDSDT